MLLITGVRIPFDEPNEAAAERARRMLSLARTDVRSWSLRRLSYDARHGGITKVCSLVFELYSAEAEQRLALRERGVSLFSHEEFKLKPGKEPLSSRPVVVGFGPAGMFAALTLAEHGYRPIVMERGQDVDGRNDKVRRFFSSGELDLNSNIQFGEGGAGAFSDGKLTTRVNDALCSRVLEVFAEHGAAGSILYEAKPHIGSDLLGGIIKSIRKRITELGGEIRFGCRVDDFGVRAGRLVWLSAGGDRVFTDAAVLAVGHSARDTASAMMRRGARLRAKSFAVGLRIEHLQSEIDRSIWGRHAGNPLLPRGEYALSTKVEGRPVYTFCMCPGGSVVAAASAAGEVVVNGMSASGRDGVNANCAVVAAVDEAEFGGDPLRSTDFQRSLEQAAFRLGGGSFAAPASDVGSFLAGKGGLNLDRVLPSYPLGVTACDLGGLLGVRIADALRMGVLEFSEKIRGFDAKDAVLTGVESRTSGPVRMLRKEDRQAEGIDNLYPCGEGAGYAGGIVSSAVDGIRTAASVIERYRPYRA